MAMIIELIGMGLLGVLFFFASRAIWATAAAGSAFRSSEHKILIVAIVVIVGAIVLISL